MLLVMRGTKSTKGFVGLRIASDRSGIGSCRVGAQGSRGEDGVENTLAADREGGMLEHGAALLCTVEFKSDAEI